jgi:surface polysaccharide O-acyltransferase-like enzyme
MAGHLWFMYPLISLYLIMPVVSPWLERATKREELIFIGLFGFTTLIPWLHRFVSPELWGECFWNQYTAFWYCSGYLGYLMLAHFIRVHLDWSRQKRLTVGWTCFLVGAAFTAWSFWWKGTPGQLIETPMLEWSWEFCTPNVLLATFGLFLVFTTIRQPKAPALVTSLGRMSFGMYLMHMFFLAPIAAYVVNGDAAHPLLPVWLAIPVIAVATYVCAYLTTRLIALLPGSKWVVGA